MTNISYELIDTQNQFDNALTTLNQASAIAVDVEFDNKYSFDLRLCLVQISTGQHIYLFDPLAIDLSPLRSVFENQQVIKIFFSGLQDIQILQTHYQWKLRSIIDVSVIYQFIRDDPNQTSLNEVVQETIGETIPKNKRIQKKEDWKQRPLPDEMKEYAAFDVRYLHRTLVKLQKDLSPIQQKLLEVYFLQMPLVRNLDANSVMYAFHLCNTYNINDTRDRYLIYKLIEFRDEIAKKLDKSSGYFISKKELKKIVSRKPTTVDDLKELGLFQGMIKNYHQQLLDLINDTLKAMKQNIPSSDRYFEINSIYHDHFPYYKHLNQYLKWPYTISVSSYRNRRGILRIIKDMIAKHVDEKYMDFIFSKYLVHGLAVNEKVSLHEIRPMIDRSESLEDFIQVSHTLVQMTYR